MHNNSNDIDPKPATLVSGHKTVKPVKVKIEPYNPDGYEQKIKKTL